MLRGALKSLLQLEDDMELAAEASNGREALEAIEACRPDICILDIVIPEMTGLEVAEAVRRRGLGCKIMIVTMFAKPGYLQKAMDLQVEGFLLKDDPIDTLIEAIRKVMNGERVVSPGLAAALFMREDNPLTERERAVLRLAKDGKSTSEIARTLFLTEGTVRNYLSSSIQKMEVESRQHAVQKAEEKGWL